MMTCPHCQSTATTERPDHTVLGYRRLRCRACRRGFNERTGTLFNDLEYPTAVVCLVVFWRFRYKLSLRDLAEMCLQRGIRFTHEAVRDWETKLALLLGDALRKRRSGAATASAQSVRKSSMRSRSAVDGFRRTSSRRMSEFRQINLLTRIGDECDPKAVDLDKVNTARQRLQSPQAVMAAGMLWTTASRGLTPSVLLRSERGWVCERLTRLQPLLKRPKELEVHVGRSTGHD